MSSRDLSSMLTIINIEAKKLKDGSFNFVIMESIPGLNSIFGSPPGLSDTTAQSHVLDNAQSRFLQFFQRGSGKGGRTGG